MIGHFNLPFSSRVSARPMFPLRTRVEFAVEIITTHKNTDFDGLASVFAARILFPEALPVLPESLNSNVRRFLSIHKDHFLFYRVKDLPPEEVTRLVIVDTASWARIEGKDRFIGRGNPEIVVIDHHPVQGDIRSNRLICRPAGAAISLVLEEVLKQRPTQLSAIQATLFISGIYEDTGNLTFPSTSAHDARTAAMLLDQGADLNLVRDLLRSPYNPAQKEILSAMLQNEHRFSENGFEVSICRLSVEGHTPGLSMVVDLYHEVNGADVTFGIFEELRKEQCIIIGRSSPNTLDIGAIMQKMGGGGHPNAGSALVKSADGESAERRICHLIGEGKRLSVQISDLMSFPVTTVAPATSMREAALLLREKGCTGLPVEENGKVVGIISRRDFQKARKAKQLKSPVAAFMSSKVIHIGPDWTVSQAVRLLVKHDIGRLPVIRNDRLIGIITRSDAMRYYYDLMPE